MRYLSASAQKTTIPFFVSACTSYLVNLRLSLHGFHQASASLSLTFEDKASAHLARLASAMTESLETINHLKFGAHNALNPRRNS